MLSELGTPAPDLRDFRISPDPPPFTIDTSKMVCTVPVDIRVQAPAPPADIAIPETPVAKRLAEDLVPVVFRAPNSSLAFDDKKMDEEAKQNGQGNHKSTDDWGENEQEEEEEEEEEQTTMISIEDNKLHRLLLHHALLGFTFGTAPFCLRTLLEAAPPSATKDAQGTVDERARKLEQSAIHFKHDLLVSNVHAISKLLTSPTAWAFTIGLEPSPYYGYGGLEARLCLYGPRRKQLSFHLVGVSNPTEDIHKLHTVLTSLCPTARLRCLGVVTNLTKKEHATQLGTMVSSVIVYFSRLAPRTQPFYTPDHAVQGKRPPLLPMELASAAAEDVKKLVDEYRQILEISWDAEDIAQIMKDHEVLTQEPKENLDAKRDSDKMTDEEGGAMKIGSLDSFDKAWDAVGPRFNRLREFMGGLATAHLYAPKPRSRVGITALEISEDVESSDELSAQAADVVLHARQFEELRSYLLQ